MDYIIPTYKWVSVTFAMLSLGTGIQALVDPIGFSKSFGMPLEPTPSDDDNRKIGSQQHGLAKSYVSLMGVRQLGTGITILIFAYQGKWAEAGTILALIGFLVAGTDGYHLARAGGASKGLFHAIPGACIAGLGAAAVYMGVVSQSHLNFFKQGTHNVAGDVPGLGSIIGLS
ncbi:hypothetical protein LTR97_002867 [Elasticomyces elasticus]|uniref:Uncharacterized protein n=1 Tax=Elasticomyces elasticus TaxID=574655 RepID=A0AAN7WFQ0_9PEZI|nr:hypothetical protein LTR97_002867 [Elasticomyces elasticus]